MQNVDARQPERPTLRLVLIIEPLRGVTDPQGDVHRPAGMVVEPARALVTWAVRHDDVEIDVAERPGVATQLTADEKDRDGVGHDAPNPGHVLLDKALAEHGSNVTERDHTGDAILVQALVTSILIQMA